jgi:hypothetical protein
MWNPFKRKPKAVEEKPIEYYRVKIDYITPIGETIKYVIPFVCEMHWANTNMVKFNCKDDRTMFFAVDKIISIDIEPMVSKK